MTTAVSARIRRRIRYSRFERQNEGRVQEGSLRRERMTCSARLPSEEFQRTQDWTNGLGISPSGRFQVIEEPREKKKLISAEGIRWDLAKYLLIVMAGLLTAVLLAEFASIGASSVQIRKLEDKIEAVQKKNDTLQEQLALSAGDVSVCTEAVKLNLISSGGAKSIVLTAPQGASMLLVESSSGNAEDGPDMRASAESN